MIERGGENGEREGKIEQKTGEIHILMKKCSSTLKNLPEEARQGVVLPMLSTVSHPDLAPTASTSSGFVSTSFTTLYPLHMADHDEMILSVAEGWKSAGKHTRYLGFQEVRPGEWDKEGASQRSEHNLNRRPILNF